MTAPHAYWDELDADGDSSGPKHRRATRTALIVGVVVAALMIGAVAFASSMLLGGPDKTSAADNSTVADAGVQPPGTDLLPSEGPPSDAAPSESATVPSPSDPASPTATRQSPTPTKKKTTPPPAPADSVHSVEEARVLQIVNTERAKVGCQPLAAEGRLALAARKHSADMAARGYFSHTTPEGVSFATRISNAGYRWSGAAENIAKGQRTPESVMTAWMNSEGHRKNILNCGLKDLGVGLATDRNGTKVWTQDFGSQR